MSLLERDAFREKLLGWLWQAASGEGRLVLLAGEAGVGKTVFVRDFCKIIESKAKVLVGACDPLSTPRPLEPLLDIAAVVGGELEHLLREADGRNQAFRSFLTILQGTTKPTVVVFEDVHWADEATLDLLRFLGRRISTTHALLIATYREDEVGHKHPLRIVIGDLATAEATRRLVLSLLSENAVRTLADGTEVDPKELHRQTGGNAFFVTEVLASGAPGVPPTVRDAVLARAGRLSPEGRTMLEVAAVVGARIEPWLLTRVASLKQEAVEECLSIGMLRAQGDVFVFRHELAREAIYDSLSLQNRVNLHARVLEVLRLSSSDDLDRLAHHAEAAGNQAAVLKYAPEAARRAAKLNAHREAVAQYARALRYADTLAPTSRVLLLEAYAHECAITDQATEAIRTRQEAIELWKQEGHHLKQGENLTFLASLLVGMGRNAEAEQASRMSLEMLEDLPQGPELALAYWYQAHLRMLNRDNDKAIIWARKAIALAEEFSDATLLIRAYNVLGAAHLMAGDDEPAVVNLLKSAELAREAGLESGVAGAYSMLGTGSGELYKLSRAEQYLKLTIAITTRLDLDNSRFYATAWLALIYLHQGRWGEASETALEVVRRPSGATISRIMALIALGRVRARRGDPEAWSVLDEALDLAAPTKTLQRLAPVHAARAEAAWLAGDQEKTREEARGAFDLAQHHKHPWFIGELAYWRWKAGDLDVLPTDAAPPFALQISGNWQEAAACWQALNCPYEAARALAESDDETALREAFERFERLGARPAATAAAKQLRELGAKGIPRGPRPTTLANPANLTQRELEVLELLVEGCSNAAISAKLVCSPKTVAHHVSSVLGKLEVQNRTEAVRKATSLGLFSQHR